MRKPKADCRTIPTYHNYRRGHVTRNGRKYYGTFFTLSKRLTDDEKSAILTAHDNTALYISQAQHAPELKSNVIFCADLNLPKGGR